MVVELRVHRRAMRGVPSLPDERNSASATERRANRKRYRVFLDASRYRASQRHTLPSSKLSGVRNFSPTTTPLDGPHFRPRAHLSLTQTSRQTRTPRSSLRRRRQKPCSERTGRWLLLRSSQGRHQPSLTTAMPPMYVRRWVEEDDRFSILLRSRALGD